MKSFRRVKRQVSALIACAALVCWLAATAYSSQVSPKANSEILQELVQPNGIAEADQSLQQALTQLWKLLLAAILGVFIAAVHKRTMKVRTINLSLEQAEILLCVAGSLMIIIIGNSLARAFGLVGAAAFIRFRTPMKDPKDTTVLFLLVGIGMACGLGHYTLAILGSLFLVVSLWLLHLFGSKDNNERLILLEVVADDFKKPQALIQKVLTKLNINYEVIKIKREDSSTFQYEVSLKPEQSLEALSDQIVAGGADAIKSISWEVRQKS